MMMEEEGLKVNKLYSDDDDLMKIDYLPPGFRFHPTDEEIITHYLKQKVLNSNFSAAAIGEADLNKSEPWDLPKKAKMGQGEKECYLFCQKDRKYPTGMRTNRATESGYWKATGKDKEIYMKNTKGGSSSNSVSPSLIGMKKTLVFYRGRAPKGEKTNWIMHEYRLDGNLSYYHLPPNTPKDEWVVSRVFQKSTGGIKKMVIIGDGDGDDDLLLDCPNYSFSNSRPHPPASIDDYCEDQFKGSNLNVTASNNKYIISNTGVHQLIDQNTYLHPPSNNYYNYPTTLTTPPPNLVPLQNHPSFPFQSPPIIPAYNITNFKVEQLSSSNQTMAVSLASQDTGLSTDMNTTADISSKHDTIRGRSNRSYEIEAAAPSSMPDYGCIWDDY